MVYVSHFRCYFLLVVYSKYFNDMGVAENIQVRNKDRKWILEKIHASNSSSSLSKRRFPRA